MEQKKERLNIVKYDAYAGFNAAKAYANFAEFFIKYLESHPDFKPTKANLKSDEFELAFQIYVRTGIPSSNIITTILNNREASKEFVNNHQAYQVFKNASELYKVIKCDKHGHWMINVDHIWYQNKIINNLTKQVDEYTQKQLAVIYEQDLQSYVNDYLTSNNSKFCKAFDNMLWWLTKIKKGEVKGCEMLDYKDLRRIFYAFQHQGHAKYGTKEVNVSFKDLYNRPSDKELSKIGSSDQYKEFTKLLQSLNLCKTFGAKAHEFLYENISYNGKNQQYEVVPPKAPNKFPFTEAEVDKYLKQIKDIKSKLPKKDLKDFASSDALMLQTNDPRLASMNTSTFGEYLVMLKIAYVYGVKPEQVWESCVQNYNNPFPGNQPIPLPNGDVLIFNTKLDSQLNGMYTATGGHADIEIYSKIPKTKNTYNYSIFEPTVYDDDVQTFRQEQDGILHILENENLKTKELKCNLASFNLISFFSEKDKPGLKNDFKSYTKGKMLTKAEECGECEDQISIHCYSYKELPDILKNIPKKLSSNKYFTELISMESIAKEAQNYIKAKKSRH